MGYLGLIPGLGRFPGEGKGFLLQLVNLMGFPLPGLTVVRNLWREMLCPFHSGGFLPGLGHRDLDSGLLNEGRGPVQFLGG